MWLLFFFDGLLFISLGNVLGNLAVLLFILSVLHVPCGEPWGIYIGVFVGAHVLWYSVDALVSVDGIYFSPRPNAFEHKSWEGNGQ